MTRRLGHPGYTYLLVVANERIKELEAEREGLRATLNDGVRIASQYFDTGRGDLDGWIDAARGALDEPREVPTTYNTYEGA